MKMKYVSLALVLMLAASVAAHAKDGGWFSDHDRYKHESPKSDPDPVAPEIDPSLAIGGITLLAGGLTALRSRKSK
ncbi:MAG: hypothetical protein ABSF70_07785 [Terracidiphilus sp.]|jgi:hypothetical protein